MAYDRMRKLVHLNDDEHDGDLMIVTSVWCHIGRHRIAQHKCRHSFLGKWTNLVDFF